MKWNNYFLFLLFTLAYQWMFAQSDQQKPINIIFILADDHRYDVMGFMNNLIGDTSFTKTGIELRTELFGWLQQTGGLQIPLKKANGMRFDNIYRDTY